MISVFIALAQFVIYAVVAAILYRIAIRLVIDEFKSRIFVALLYWAALAVAPHVLILVAGWAAQVIYTHNQTLQVGGWDDVGLALWLFISMWACYLFGFVAACWTTWRIYQVSSRGAAARAK